MVKEIYLDNASTTKVLPDVAKGVLDVLTKNYGNASSLHKKGEKARDITEMTREKVAKFIKAKPSEIIFTSGGTESNNLAIRGLAKANPKKKHIITSVIEHPSVLETCKDLEEEGYNVDYVKVDKEGIVDLKDLKDKINDDTLVVSVMHVNNEIGTIQPIEEIGQICRERKVYFHTDAVQSFKKLEIDVSGMNVDLMSVSGHKFGAPKGIGFLYVKQGTNIKGILTGGGQEKGLRSGTENTSGIVGLAVALDFDFNRAEIRKLRDKMIEEILKIGGVRINGSVEKRVHNNINVSFFGIEGESLMLLLNEKGIFVSTGSACASSKLRESYVLKAIGVDEMYINGSIRITLGEITEKDAEDVVKCIKESVERLKKISPFKFKEEI
ncbi:MAG: cysteine desulfurase family protein [Candidatus Pacearchaeota archaeon]